MRKEIASWTSSKGPWQVSVTAKAAQIFIEECGFVLFQAGEDMVSADVTVELLDPDGQIPQN